MNPGDLIRIASNRSAENLHANKRCDDVVHLGGIIRGEIGIVLEVGRFRGCSSVYRVLMNNGKSGWILWPYIEEVP
jgi:hypothetical protein